MQCNSTTILYETNYTCVEECPEHAYMKNSVKESCKECSPVKYSFKFKEFVSYVKLA